MPEVMSFIISEGVRRENIGIAKSADWIIGPVQILSPFSIPSNYSFFTTLAIYEINESEIIKLMFKSPDGEIVYNTTDIPLSNIEHGNVPEKYRSVVFSFDIRNMHLKEEGIYTAEIFVDDVLIGAYKIPVCVLENQT